MSGGRYEKNYEQIIGLPHHISDKHEQMSLHDRAAQFSPFAALTGYEELVDEEARLTESRKVLDEDIRAELDRRLLLLAADETEHPEISVMYFLKDADKDGGSYLTKTGHVKRIDSVRGMIMFTDRTEIQISDISFISGDIFGNDKHL